MDRLTARATAVALAAVTLTASCAGHARTPRIRATASQPPPPPPALAFATRGQVRLRTGDGSVRVLAAVPHGRVVRRLSWSADGRRLAWLTLRPNGAADRVYLLASAQTRGSGVRSWRCGCTNIAFDGDRLLSDDVAQDGPPRLLQYSGTGAPRAIMVRGLPARSEYAVDPVFTLHAGADAVRGVIVGYTVPGGPAYGGPQQLYELGQGGRVEKLTLDQGEAVPRAFGYSPDGRRLAYVTQHHGGFCSNPSAVTIVDLAGRTARTPAMPPNADQYQKWYVRAAWFDEHGTAFASFAPTVELCSGDRPDGQVQPEVYQEDRGRWRPTGQTALVRAYTRTGWHADLDGTVRRGTVGLGEDSPFGGTLTVVYGRQAGSVADGVTGMAWAPSGNSTVL